MSGPAERRSRIDAIYVACYRYDVRFTRILAASIRHWYADRPIVLVKDRSYGDFDTTDIERTCRATVLATPRRAFGWGFGKLEPLFLPSGQRVLILDSDTLFAGPALDLLEQFDEDFLVQREDPPDRGFVEGNYFDLDGLRDLDPAFVFPGYTFNTGQIVATTGLLRREDFAPFVTWHERPAVVRPDVFKLGEQGLLNYVLMRAAAAGTVSLRRVRFMELPNTVVGRAVAVDAIARGDAAPLVLHWCGLRQARLGAMPRADVLAWFERRYYAGLRFGACRRWWRAGRAAGERTLRAAIRRQPAIAHAARAARNAGASIRRALA